MKKILLEHISAILFVAALLFAFSLYLGSWQQKTVPPPDELVAKIASMSVMNPGDPLHQAILVESLDTFYPRNRSRTDSLIEAITEYKRVQILDEIQQSRRTDIMSTPRLLRLAGMYLSFLFVFLVVMLLIYYGSQTLGIYLFVRHKQNRKGYLEKFHAELSNWKEISSWNDRMIRFLHSLILLAKISALGIFYSIAFAPAYVIAYSFRTKLPTDTTPFLILLGIFTNGILITYSEKFFHFLSGESRKGFIETARVKNLNDSYQWDKANGIPFSAIFRFRKRFPGHVLGHIYLNARYQYLSSFKEQASFVITGLIIIEMALNIQGHLGYELLQNILYHHIPVVLLIVFGIFLVVKATELIADIWYLRETERFENH